MRNVTKEELKEILDKHAKWLRNEDGGESADLRSADLRSADLRSADLSYADLRSADLRYMADYIEREAALRVLCDACGNAACPKGLLPKCSYGERMLSIPAADVRPVVTCTDCKHNNACLTQAFVEEASRVPFDRNTFFCADGKRTDDA